jgi:hypothetical protein
VQRHELLHPEDAAECVLRPETGLGGLPKTTILINSGARSGFVEFETDVVYAVRRDANGAGIRLRQLQDQEHRAGYAKGSERRYAEIATNTRLLKKQRKLNGQLTSTPDKIT